MDKIVEITGLSKHYKGFSLKNISFSLERGYIMGFIGPNGAGKSTTIKLMMNLVKKDGGQIKLFGLDHEKDEIAVKERIGFVYDENCFYDELTVEEMKNFIRPFYRRWDEAAFKRYVREFGLPLNKQIKRLSKGMKMKFALAAALSHHAELLIMDEPTSGLDPLVRNELLDILRTLMEDGDKSVFFSTHITSDLDKIADYITLIHEGEILLSTTKEELLEEYCIVKGGKNLDLSACRELFIGLEESRYGIAGLARNKGDVIKRLGGSAVIEKPTLEDILLFFTSRSDSHVSSH